MSQIEEMIKEATRVEEDATYSARGHFHAALRWRYLHYWIGIPTSVLAAVTGASIVADATTLAAMTSAVVAALAALQTFLNPNEKAQRHHSVGTRFNTIRNQARIFRNVQLLDDGEVDDLREQLISLASSRDALNESAPPIPPRAFVRARASIERGEASYDVDRKPK